VTSRCRSRGNSHRRPPAVSTELRHKFVAVRTPPSRRRRRRETSGADGAFHRVPTADRTDVVLELEPRLAARTGVRPFRREVETDRPSNRGE
jgi:hypothetical protein